MTAFFEIAMLISFGFSWPASVLKSYRARTAKGKSLFFLCMILFGYLCGILSKLLSGEFKWYVLFFYVLNFSIVSLDFVLYFRNRLLDKQNENLSHERKDV
jgi:bacteriorhodopsin